MKVIQAVKFYPNLHPGAVEPINPNNIFRLNSFAGQYRLHKVNSHGVNVPNQQYNFVRTREGEMLLHARYRHPSIAEGKQVLYAGEIFFNNGKLEWWSNGSGHYQPFAEDAGQANLPMDHFYSYQQIIKGEHARKQGRDGYKPQGSPKVAQAKTAVAQAKPAALGQVRNKPNAPAAFHPPTRPGSVQPKMIVRPAVMQKDKSFSRVGFNRTGFNGPRTIQCAKGNSGGKGGVGYTSIAGDYSDEQIDKALSQLGLTGVKGHGMGTSGSAESSQTKHENARLAAQLRANKQEEKEKIKGCREFHKRKNRGEICPVCGKEVVD